MFDIAPRDPGLAAIDALATAMADVADGGGQNQRIPAGYTYLSQFVDHDITFDATSQLAGPNDPDEVVNVRTPRLDLDSLYGAGPVDQPYMYDWGPASHGGAKLLVSAPPERRLATRDLPRNEQGRALIGDPRNDENLIVSQLHLLFARFHNRVVDLLHAGADRPEGGALFAQARRLVRLHYQWIVMHDLLPRLLGSAPPEHGSHDWGGEPFIPIEFSAAAFRFGHSLVRRTYIVNDLPGDGIPVRSIGILPGPTHLREDQHLAGFRPLLAALEIEWKHFFPTTPGVTPRPSLTIDEHLSAPLFRLPLTLAREVVTVVGASATAPTTTQLARLNLLRGRALGLPAGADVAHALGADPLGRGDLFPGDGVVLAEEVKDALLDATPLWYYLLCEARVRGDGGRQLGPVGATIVAEVFLALLEADPESYVRESPPWSPKLSPVGELATMVDLVRFVEATA
jgi:hypothetical protein